MVIHLIENGTLCNQILDNIPENPRIPMYNFLLDLTSENDKEKSIYFTGADSFITEMWNEIIQKNWRQLYVRKFIPQQFKVSCGEFYSYKNGKKRISIRNMYQLTQAWRRLCDKNEQEFLRKWDEIFNEKLLLSTHSKCQKTSLPRYISPKLSYLLGWLCGDGNLQYGKNRYLIKISEKSKEQLEKIIKPLFQELFGVNPQIYLRYGKGYAIQIGSKPIYNFFTKIMKIKVGEIPAIINEFDLVNKKYFLIRIFDSEGYVNATYQNSRIIITQAKKVFLKTLIRLFNEQGFYFNGPLKQRNNLGEWYRIDLRRKLEIVRYARCIGSCHIDKLRKLSQLVDTIEKNWGSKFTLASRKSS